MKRTYTSGSQKKKRAVEEKEKISKLPKLSAWFTLGATATAPLDTASTSMSTPASTSTSNLPVPDTPLSTPAAGDFPQEEMHESVTAKENVIYLLTDPGLWNTKNVS
ncbi:uncharacterized protein LOC121853551 [Homarus americanus]|nr:uncharacterized protein LOC121853551 [Homarus americanus]